MSDVALALSGWLAAAGATLAAALVLHVLHAHREAAARAVHELRGPLTAIGLGLELGVRGPATEAPIQRALELELSRARLALEDLSGARRPRAAASPTRLERLAAAELVLRSVEAAGPAAAAAGVRVTAATPPAAAFVWGDPLRLAQAVGNLIVNALEHGAGDVEVRCAAPSGAVRIEVCDQGPGLPAPVRELIRGARAGRGRRGRGLAIAAAVAEQHRGRLAAAPAERGARVVLELPAVG